MNNLPLVTVIIPVYNYANYIAATLDSVFAQTYRPIEVIVVDDGSTDNSAEIMLGYPEVQYLYQSNQGVSVARNMAIAAAKGEFIAFLDADDLWKPDKLSLQIAYMLENPHIGITGTRAINFLESDTQLPPWLKDDPNWEEDRVIIPSTMVVHKSVFSQVGNFSPDYRVSEDTEWQWRAKDAKIPMFKINEILTLRRFHGSNLSWEMAATHKPRMLKIIKDSIARQSIEPR
ncbi:glycosyltransferase family A protein [Anabaena cylindrica UHCC 0172]|uniref:glycosyltransferase family 2 protein n=1 Tax=Anabaena cylindrica TaxID=1165 RepID=UPI002B1EEC67|nr:glycosyltransferase family A protein [Anabaena cylindrica]MEA5550657.1 glycosyltransferase family A protein [Anabaena cylindrica UHCC 0172]